MSSLNPVVRIREQFIDFPAASAQQEADAALARCELRAELDLPPEALDAYPHQLSGGMRQRIMVALATFFQPEIILADEPTTALDVVVQKEHPAPAARAAGEMKNTIIFVSHDMGVHYQLTHRMLIMYAAKAVEYGPTDEIFCEPLHPYTLLLIVVAADDRRRSRPAGPPGPAAEPVGPTCRLPLRPACPLATDSADRRSRRWSS